MMTARRDMGFLKMRAGIGGRAAAALGAAALGFLVVAGIVLADDVRRHWPLQGSGETPAAAEAVEAAEAEAGDAADSAGAKDTNAFRPLDVFELEWVTDPRISPDGERIVYVRNAHDIFTDRRRANLWMINFDGTRHRPVLSGPGSYGSPRWSPDGGRLAYVATVEGRPQLHVRWMDTGETAVITNLAEGPGNLAWSPDGKSIAFTMRVPAEAKPLAKMPKPPKGAQWAEPVKVIDRVTYRADGAGFLELGYTHVFTVPAEGGTPRQLTGGDFNHGGPLAWSPDAGTLILSANRHDGWELKPLNSELFALNVKTGAMTALTTRDGPDGQPAIAPSGRSIAYTGFDDEKQGYQVARLYTASTGGEPRLLTEGLDRSVQSPSWDPGGGGVYVLYDDQGTTKLALVNENGKVTVLAGDVGGTSLGRPYSSGSYTAARNGRYAYTAVTPTRPAELAVGRRGENRVITRLNEDLLDRRDMAEIEEMRVKSSHDGRDVQAWIAKPPGFDPEKKYPLILEIHGGPFANYGPRFAAEIQLFAAAGYVVVYANPRGSTSYGGEFGNLIHHNYPGEDYDDLISVVDGVIARGYVDTDNLFVTGGSGGGVLTAWIVGKTDRFRAAVVAKPVINWQSFALTADFANFFHQYWFPAPPWEAPDHYWKRSPLSLVGNVSTPTMLLTGEEDWRTPMSETEQYYQALKLRKVDTAMVRVPGAGHGIAARPSNLIAKVANILAWFERYRTDRKKEVADKKAPEAEVKEVDADAPEPAKPTETPDAEDTQE
jgi:dipeptidyl aminopeptidase/acylaminoacyl peptidase